MPFLPSFRSVGAKSVKSGFMAFLALASILTASGQTIFFDFETAGEFADNFRVTLSTPDSGQTIGYIYQNRQTGNTSDPFISVYDPTPGDPSDTPTFSGPTSVSFDISAVNTNSSFGVYFFDPSNTGKNLLALFNLNGGSSDQIRLQYNSSLTTSSAGTTLPGGNNVTGTSGLSPSSEASPVWGLMTVVYTPGDSSDTLSLTVGSLSHTATISGTQRLGVDPAIALRINDASTAAGSAKLTNLQIASIPEPSTLLLLGAGALGLFLLRKRKSP